MKQFTGLVKRISSSLNILAGLCVFLVMLLIVSNIILRVVFKHPILGTYELVGFLAALAIAFGLAQCALQNGHIAVGLIMECFSNRIQSFIESVVNIISLLFWGAVTWYLFQFGVAMMNKGLVSLSAQIPVHPFIFLVGLGVAGLCIALFFKSLTAMREVLAELPIGSLSSTFKASAIAERAER